jgi:predicted ATPase
MLISRIILKNWRNFRKVNVPLRDRMFLVGANASGKSNFLDVFRFLRELSTTQGGGLQKAVAG